jgi:CDP-diacylglycerol--serine O-phosphatidyltransferase
VLAQDAAAYNMNLPSPSTTRRRGIYILPNLLTTAALFCGYFAIVQAMNQNFEAAAIAIFVAMVFDGLDGRVARLTGTQSEFGVHYDSLSDMVSFGIAPALLAYQWALMDLNKLGWIVSFVYCSGAALRLARFNTNVGIADKRFFQGLPSPAAAALIAGMVWVSTDNSLSPKDFLWLKSSACLLTFIGGISMVSNFPFWSGKNINLRKSVPFIVVIALALAFALGALYPPGVFFGLFVCYALSGYALSFWRWRRRRAAAAAARRAAAIAEAESQPSPDGEEETEQHVDTLPPQPETPEEREESASAESADEPESADKDAEDEETPLEPSDGASPTAVLRNP